MVAQAGAEDAHQRGQLQPLDHARHDGAGVEAEAAEAAVGRIARRRLHLAVGGFAGRGREADDERVSEEKVGSEADERDVHGGADDALRGEVLRQLREEHARRDARHQHEREVGGVGDQVGLRAKEAQHRVRERPEAHHEDGDHAERHDGDLEPLSRPLPRRGPGLGRADGVADEDAQHAAKEGGGARSGQRGARLRASRGQRGVRLGAERRPRRTGPG